MEEQEGPGASVSFIIRKRIFSYNFSRKLGLYVYIYKNFSMIFWSKCMSWKLSGHSYAKHDKHQFLQLTQGPQQVCKSLQEFGVYL